MKKLILGITLISLVSLNGICRTYQSIIDQIRLDLRDNGPSSEEYIYAATDIYRAISIVEEQISGETQIPETIYSSTTVVAQDEYDLPTDILGKPTRVAWYNSASTSTFKRLDFYTVGSLDTENENWESRGDGLPRKYYLRANKIGLSPAPSVDYSTTTWNCLRVYYVQNPDDVTASNLTEEPFGGYPQYQHFSGMLIVGVEAYLTGDTIKEQKYIAFLENMRKRVKEKQDMFIDRDPNRRMQ